MAKKRVVVTGMGIVSCFGNDVDTFYQSLLEGKSGVKLITRIPVEEMPTRIAADVLDFDPDPYIDKKQARRLDRYAQFALVAGKKALIHSGFPTLEAYEGYDLTRFGVLIGSGM